MDYIISFVKELHNDISDKALNKFLNLFKEIKFYKKDVFIKQGEISKDIYLIKSGIARSYYTDNNGKEFIRNFFIPITTFGFLNSKLKKEPSFHAYDCLTDCVFFKGDFSAFTELAKTDLELAFLLNKILELKIFNFTNRINELSSLNATDLYEKLKIDIPNIDNLIPLYHIASYLNITSVQLSRIRKKNTINNIY